jgi:membrane-bound lytic murein transglycosylase B
VDAECLSKFDVNTLVYDGDAVDSKMLDILKPSGDSFEGYTWKKSIRKVKKFLADPKRKKAFRKAKRESRVPPEVVASILFIETTYKAYEPRYHALPALASLAALSIPEFAEQVANHVAELADVKYPNHEAIDWKERAQTKIGEPWYEQLKAYLELSHRMGWKPHLIKSSWAGAIGLGQFMPQTALRLMNRDGKFWPANLWSWNDTILLVARHVAENGWNTVATDSRKMEAVRLYNGRRAYADTVLKMVDLVEKSPSVDPVLPPKQVGTLKPAIPASADGVAQRP